MRPFAPNQINERGGRILTLLYAFAWAALINIWTWVRFARDKRRAALSHWRVSESELLSLAFFGGTPAAFAARHLLRHKTRKQPFSTYLQLTAMVQVAVLIGLAITSG